MGTCLGSCFGSCCASCACSACDSCCPKKSPQKTRIPYMIIFFLGAIAALVMRYWGKEWVIKLYWFSYTACSSAKCVGYPAVYRISFTLFLFFGTHMVMMLSKSCWSFHHTNWLFKTIYLFASLIIAFIVPNEFFDIYSIIARFVSAIFLLLQLLILIDFAYKVFDKLFQTGSTKEKALVLTLSLIFYGVSLAVFILSLTKWFRNGGPCHTQTFLIAFTFVLTFLISVLSFTGWVEHGNILTSSIVTVYSYWLLFTSLNSDPSSCNSTNGDDIGSLIIGIIMAACTVTYSAWSLAHNFKHSEEVEQEKDLEKARAIAVGDAKPEAPPPADEENPSPKESPKKSSGDGNGDGNNSDEVPEDVGLANRRFHIIMTSAALYMAMLLTNWGVETESSSAAYDVSSTNVWIRIGTQWATLALYGWTLVAPKVCPNRDFGY